MRIKLAGSLVAGALLVTGTAMAQGGQGRGRGPAAPALRLTSPAFPDGSVIPDKYAGQGAVSPELTWTNTPMGTVTFALLFHDPDVALQRKLADVTHWIAWNIPGTATKLDEGIKEGATLPDGTVQGKNTRGTNAYMGPGAPAAGPEHHYTFELFALDTKLDLGADASRDDVMKAMDGHILGKAVWEGRFHQHQQ